MPHFIVEYSSNLDDEIKMRRLLNTLHDAALETGVFPLGGIRLRAQRVEQYLIADGDPENAFVHLSLRIGHGRDLETRKKAGEHIFEALKLYLRPIFEKRPLAISFEITEAHEVLNFKENNIHTHIKNKQN